jgi:hypothetical protein
MSEHILCTSTSHSPPLALLGCELTVLTARSPSNLSQPLFTQSDTMCPRRPTGMPLSTGLVELCNALATPYLQHTPRSEMHGQNAAFNDTIMQ